MQAAYDYRPDDVPDLVSRHQSSYICMTVRKAGEIIMSARMNRSALGIVLLIAVLTTQVIAVRVFAQSHPQEVLDLMTAHDALEMKIRALQDRAAAPSSSQGNSASFNPDGVPIRATAGAAADDSSRGAEARIPDRLRHKDRATNSSDDYARIRARLQLLDKKAATERERLSQPGFGTRTYRLEREAGEVRFGDGRRGSRLPAGTNAQDRPVSGAAESIAGNEIASARAALADLERELATVERELNKLEKN
jgi:hypothetical protein